MCDNLVCLNQCKKQHWFRTVVMRRSANQCAITPRITCGLTEVPKLAKAKTTPFIFVERAKNIPQAYDIFQNIYNPEWPICVWFNTLKKQHTVIRTVSVVPTVYSVSKRARRHDESMNITLDTLTGVRSFIVESTRCVRRKRND